MPELPEVETMVRGLAPLLEGKLLLEIKARDPVLAWVPGALKLPATVRRLTRRGKYALFHLGDRLLVIHPRMSGRLVWSAKKDPERARLSLRFPHGTVHFVDLRRLGTVEVTSEFPVELGPEPLGDLSWLGPALRGSRQPVKLWLMDQRNIAGIGNIYASEILFRAGIDPRRPAGALRPAEVQRLASAIPQVLKEAIAAAGTTLADGSYLGPNGELGEFPTQVYGREGEPCFHCGNPIERTILGGRSTFLCPSCQR